MQIALRYHQQHTTIKNITNSNECKQIHAKYLQHVRDISCKYENILILIQASCEKSLHEHTPRSNNVMYSNLLSNKNCELIFIDKFGIKNVIIQNLVKPLVCPNAR